MNASLKFQETVHEDVAPCFLKISFVKFIKVLRNYRIHRTKIFGKCGIQHISSEIKGCLSYFRHISSRLMHLRHFIVIQIDKWPSHVCLVFFVFFLPVRSTVSIG